MMTDDPEVPEIVEKCKEVGRSCACYHLRRTARAITRLYDSFLRPCGLRVTQYSVLIVTGLRGPVGITKLAEMTLTERTTLTRNLRLLEKKELIRITPGKDRRDRLVSITEKGRQLLLEATELWKTAQAHIESGLGEDRMNRLYADLSEIVSLTRKA